jgi:hypothetical protein
VKTVPGGSTGNAAAGPESYIGVVPFLGFVLVRLLLLAQYFFYTFFDSKKRDRFGKTK